MPSPPSAKSCWTGIVKPVTAVRYVVALGKRGLMWELLPDAVLPNVLVVHHAE